MTRPDARLVWALAAVLLIGFALRAQASLLTEFIPGDDGAYYLVQVRAILRDGRLALPDFPLLFYFQAAIAWGLSLVMATSTAIVAAVRWTDALVPLIVAVPVYLFVRAFADREGRGAGPVLAMVLAGLVAVASDNALMTAGGMIKNAVTLPFSLLFLFYLYRSLRDREPRAIALAVLFFLLSSLSHVSGLVLNVALLVFALAAALATPETRPRVQGPAIALAAGLAGTSLLVWLVDRPHAVRLLNAVAHPGWLFADSAVSLWLRGAPNPALQEIMTSEEMWLGGALVLIGSYTIWRHRRGMDSASRVVIVAATLTTLAFIAPVLRPDVLERLALNAYLPGLVPVIWLLCREASGALIVAPITALAMLGGALALKTLRVTALVRPAYDELVRLKAALPPGRTIVITRHGLEWWAAWTMDTHFSDWAGRALADRDAYDAVLVLDEIRWGAFGEMRWPRIGSAPGAGVFDGALLRSYAVTTLAQGEYFRLSLVGEPRPDRREATGDAGPASPMSAAAYPHRIMERPPALAWSGWSPSRRRALLRRYSPSSRRSRRPSFRRTASPPQ